MKKQTLLNLLTWLQINNLLYQNAIIKHNILSSIMDEFILRGISSSVIIIENNSSKRKGYKTNLVKNNDENDLYHAIRSANSNELGILSGCIYIDVNKSR